MLRRASVFLSALIFLLIVGCAAVEIREDRTLTGRVVDEAGVPVANCPVLVVARSLRFKPTQLEYAKTAQQEIRTQTDSDGRYRLDFTPSTLGNNLTLFFYDRSGFDTVQYRTPESRDVTDLLRRDRVVSVDQVLLFSPTWPEIARQIAFYGAASDRGRILRRHGLPEERGPSASAGPEAAETWWYRAQGVSYSFSGDRLVQTQTFQPTQSTP